MNKHHYTQYLLLLSIFFTMGACSPSSARLLSMKKHTTSILAFQEKLNTDFKSEHSPLKGKEKEQFTKLDYFPIDKKYQVLATFKRTPREMPFAMPTSSDKTPIHVQYGTVTFQLDGETFRLNLYQNTKMARTPAYKYYLFLPFTDLTNGDSSYGGGRYIDLQVPKGDKIIIDFNKAYNPLCAYAEGYSCPIPPKENFLDIEIRAGVKAWKQED